MPRTVIEVDGVGHGTMPIPTAVRIGPLLVTGSISGRSRSDGTVPTEFSDEVATLYSNIEAVVNAAGLGLDDIAKITFFVRDRAIRDDINERWLEKFPNPTDRPARHVVAADIPPALNVQAEVLAFGHSSPQEPTPT